MNMDSNHIAIIGAGPAGLACSILLAKQGWDISLFERKTFPHNKVCGEFLSPESWQLLHHLDVLDSIRDAHPSTINELLIADSNGIFARSPLHPLTSASGMERSGFPDTTLSAFGLSRETLDSILYEKAKQLGVQIYTGYSVKEFQVDSECVTLKCRGDRQVALTEFTSSFLIIASGRQPNPSASGMERSLRISRRPSLFGIKAHFQNVAQVDHRVELHSFIGGYLGLANINENLTNLCFVIQQSSLSHYHGNLDHLVKDLIDRSPLLKERLNSSNRVGQWYSTGPLHSGLQRFYENRAFYVGDACGAIEPLSGDGITMALTGATILSDLLTDVKRSGVPLKQVGQLYQNQILGLFSSPLRLSRVLGYLARHPHRSTQVIHCLRYIPSLLETIITRTRIPVPFPSRPV